ncbi:MAG: filamentous hemagglutinin N-terminal domain-containing protein, partial [Candidatus Omnitrophica bacterium]|nr:filamentous hemagglutinin N-terminal domain-containing protein [Candidatus Omnitrophota bacterium]
MSSKYKEVTFLLAVIVVNLIFSLTAYGLPEGENIVVGSATIDRSNPDTLNINTPSDKLIVDYNSFSIARQETVNFNQPSANAVALNRVVGQDPSSIMGTLTANGNIFLINPNGVIFGRDSRVDVAGLVASTLNISNEDFLKGNYNFYKETGKNGYIINQGNITIKNGGYACLLSQAVENQGKIEANLGTVVLASGEKMTLALDDLNDISVVIDEPVKEAIFGPDGKQMDSAIKNTGTISANGGKVLLTAKVLNNVFNYAINNSGIIEARSLSNHNGVVELTAEGAPIINTGTIEASELKVNTKDSDFINEGRIEAEKIEVKIKDADFINRGEVIADTYEDSTDAGEVIIEADEIAQHGVISANACEEGSAGTIEIISRDLTVLDEESRTEARAIGIIGNGGRIIINSTKGNTLINRNAVIDVSAGSISGNAGFIEISAFDQLGFYGVLNGRAPPGYQGATVLFDPTDLYINSDITQTGNYTASADNIYINAIVSVTNGNIDFSATDTFQQNSGIIKTISSGNIKISASKIILLAISSAGDVTITATHSTEDLTQVARSSITLTNGATISGYNIIITATATHSNKFDDSNDSLIDQVLDFLEDSPVSPAAVSIAQADAKITIGQASVINARNDLTLKATAKADAKASATFTGTAVSYAKSISSAQIIVESGTAAGTVTQINTGNDFNLNAISETNLTSSAKTINLGHGRGSPVDASLAYGESNSVSKVKVSNGADISVGGGLLVKAETNKKMNVSGSASSYEDGSVGIGLAISKSSSQTEAILEGTANVQEDIRVEAKTDIPKNDTKASAGVGTGAAGKFLIKATTALTDKINKYISVKNPKPDSRSGSKTLAVSAAFAYADHTENAIARIGDSAQAAPTATVTSQTGKLDVIATIENMPEISAISTIDSEKLALTPSGNTKDNSVSAAVVVGNYKNTTDAFIGKNSIVNANKALSVIAKTQIPYEIQWFQFSGFADIRDKANSNFGIQNGIFTSWAQSNAQGDKTAIAGSVNVMDLTNSSNAYIDENAQVNQDATYRSPEQDVIVAAKSRIDTVNLSGVFGFKFFGAQAGKAGVGGAYLGIEYTNTAEALIKNGAKVYGDSLAVIADSTTRNISISESGGKAEAFALAGTFSLLQTNNSSIAQIDDAAEITTGSGTVTIPKDIRKIFGDENLITSLDDVEVENILVSLDTNNDDKLTTADTHITGSDSNNYFTDLNILIVGEDKSQLFNVSGGVVKAQNVGIGASVSINEITRDTKALIGNKPGEPKGNGSLSSSG